MEIITKRDKFKITVTAFLLTFITGVLVVLPFILKSSADETLQISMVEVGKIFSYFMIGMVITQFFNGYIIKYIRPKMELFIIAGIYLVCLAGMFKINGPMDAPLLAVIIFVIGLCAGVIVTIPNYIIVHTFNEKERTSRLNLLDFFFSAGSSGYPYIVSWLFVYNFNWRDIYATVVIVWVLIILMLLITKFPVLESHEGVKIEYSKWNTEVLLVGAAIFCFFISYTGFTYILSGCLQTMFSNVVSPDQAMFYATNSITIFWLFYAVGCVVSSIAIHKIPVNKYIIYSAIVAAVAYFWVYNSTSVWMVYTSVAVLGLGCATTYSSSIAYGTQLVKNPSPRLISFFIVASGVGTFAGEYLSNIWFSIHGYGFVTLISAVFMIFVAIFYLMVSVIVKNK